MFRALFFIVKISFLSAFVLVLGNVVQWNGKTVSDQVKVHLSYAEKAKDWAKDLISDAKKGASRKSAAPVAPVKRKSENEIISSEKRKLRALLHELNSARSQD